ncbi:glycosyltransferase family 50 protein [Xylona heveae TC161]|uniref:GPI mannosyltransferase 1 n=1 Tax=Xylona heveae (strain CBS 132557 / TC161) TaxID=1328760 RepID=A0A165I113_XYLHT|nr:glycosyltransferase family 50 protein [Xylona heveae TC161]KZF24204.1 glycosyltransferase family 50 protein [Xylona heveae TC161]
MAPTSKSKLTGALSTGPVIFSAAILLRIILLFYGLWQDANSPMKYTDIDYYVFTDAARFVAHGESPYARDTYRYTPILSWLLLPTAWHSVLFSFGKAMFAIGDIITGWLIILVLRSTSGMSTERALRFASIWLLNPMVATISTRGSSEGLLGVMVMALLWAVVNRRITLAGFLLGFGVHFKIYPFIYAPSIIWWLDDEHLGSRKSQKSKALPSPIDKVFGFVNKNRINLTLTSLATFAALNVIMFQIYGWPFVDQTYLHHVTRLDHRHNFSPYNTLLYLTASQPSAAPDLSRLAFIPQLLLSTVLIPLVLAKRDLASTMLAQTFAFVTFNKVCTSQYFLWYLVLLPLHLPRSSLLQKPRRGILALVLWIAGQALWLQRGYELEFLGRSTYAPSLWIAGIFFFAVNVWILGIIVTDTGANKVSKLKI